MGNDLQGFWIYLTSTPLLGLTLTLLAYLLAHSFYVWRQYAPWANPLLWAALSIIIILELTHTAYETYFEGAMFIHFLLGPSVVALALPLWERLPQLKKQALPLLGAALIGGSVAVASVVIAAWLIGLPAEVIYSLAPKSLTSPVAMGVAEKIGGIAPLAAIFTIITGVMGAMIGKTIFKIARIRSDAARGFALGTCSHGVGTASALMISPVAGAYAALALSVQAVLGALLIPLVMHLFT